MRLLSPESRIPVSYLRSRAFPPNPESRILNAVSQSRILNPVSQSCFRLAALFALVAVALASPAAIRAEATSDGMFGDDEQIDRTLEEIKASPDFRRLREKPPQPVTADTPEWMEKFMKWLADLFQPGDSAVSGIGSVLQALAYAFLAAICCLIIWLVVKAVNNYRAKHSIGGGKKRSYEEGEAEIPPGDLPADEYLRRAGELAEKGLFREAIGQLILGAMSATERGGLIRFRRGLTHRDYLRALRGRTQQHHAFRTIVSVYEPICFGRRPAQIEHYRTSLDGYQSGFRQTMSPPAATAGGRS